MKSKLFKSRCYLVLKLTNIDKLKITKKLILKELIKNIDGNKTILKSDVNDQIIIEFSTNQYHINIVKWLEIIANKYIIYIKGNMYYSDVTHFSSMPINIIGEKEVQKYEIMYYEHVTSLRRAVISAESEEEAKEKYDIGDVEDDEFYKEINFHYGDIKSINPI